MSLSRRVTLYGVPYAGGTTTAFRQLPDTLGQAIRFVPLELPGRGFRAGEPLCRTVDAMVASLLEAMVREAEDPGGPYCLFGHSMGARLAYLAAVRRQALGEPGPVHLFLGGEGPPEASPWTSDATAMEREDRFRAEIIGSGAYPEELLRRPDAGPEILPVLRADLAAFDGYSPPRPPKLECPVTAILASRDVVRREDVERWGRRTAGRFEVKTVTGNHFFFMKHMPALGKIISDALRERGAPPAGGAA
jgi:surfactin synthase thioesterase subunit